ncbi:MAG TPA: acetolactate decarboxylase [Acidimicrobiia bacterium]
MAPKIEIEVSETVRSALEHRIGRTGESLDTVVDALLSEALELNRHSLFQVSTSNALVQGVFGGVITVGDLKQHGDFGLGTFTGLDGELVLIDGDCFRASAGGAVEEASEDDEVPFALVARFHTDAEESIGDESSLEEVTEQIDAMRPSENVFVGIRIDGEFSHLSMRAACKAHPGESLVEATSHQSEFEATDIAGSVVGFWSPPYSKAISVPGYHFHFVSYDRKTGGHVLALVAREGRVRVHTESDLHLALPVTAEFLTADLSGDHEGELKVAESERRSR